MNVIFQAFDGHLGDTELATISIVNNVITGFDFGLLVGLNLGLLDLEWLKKKGRNHIEKQLDLSEISGHFPGDYESEMGFDFGGFVLDPETVILKVLVVVQAKEAMNKKKL
ncbi:Protein DETOXIFICATION [Forsythia ovata]|uniref:Protein DETOXIFICATION n=1 Tax=Forsythia ovata TaxID=205694 RepID=A0ABD1UXH9_9LAMI